MTIKELIGYTGLYAPAFLFVLTLFLLRNAKHYFRFFIAGAILNNVLNVLLKLSIKEPRPDADQKAIEIGVVNGVRIGYDKFGMPSGHAQNCAYCLAFVSLALHNNPSVIAIYLCISIISVFQRYLYNNHTILQLAIGFVVGLMFGHLIYFLGSKNIKGNIKMKKDDYFF